MMEDESSFASKENFPVHYHLEVVLASSLMEWQDVAFQNRVWVWMKSHREELKIGKYGEIYFSDDISTPTVPGGTDVVKMRVMTDYEDIKMNPSDFFSPENLLPIYTFELSHDEICTEEIQPSGGDDEWTAGCDSLTLPHVTLDGLWESLIFNSNIKRKLLEYAKSAIRFSEKQVFQHIVHWNRILLLHGPPGTGKTSLCRALAHKLSIRLRDRFPRTTLLEIHSHSLFSKWFSTSGKLVSALFSMVRDMVEDDPERLICVLIDEVESLASSRSNTGNGDPSDAMRAVNSLLTSLDRLRPFPNVFVMATTNITGRIDDAFVDRVDLKMHIGMPIIRARYEILKSCLEELMRTGIVDLHEFAEFASLAEKETGEGSHANGNVDVSSKLLLDCAQRAEGLSGRSLRRLPLQAHAQFLPPTNDINEKKSVQSFLKALSLAVDSEQESRLKL